MMIVACIVCMAKTVGFQVDVALAHDANPVAADGQQLPVTGVIFDVAAAVGLIGAAGLEFVAGFTVNALKRKISGKGGGCHVWFVGGGRSPLRCTYFNASVTVWHPQRWPLYNPSRLRL